jgi:plasmid replication initiation protein
VYYDAASGARLDGRFTILSSIAIERRRSTDREQLALFPTFSESEPGDARVIISPMIRANIAAGYTVTLSAQRYLSLSSPVARRLYRLLEVAREDGTVTWRIALEQLAEQMPLAQRYPSHLQRVLLPAHQMLLAEGLARDIVFKQQRREWFVDYVLASRLV